MNFLTKRHKEQRALEVSDWMQLTDTNQLSQIKESSSQKPVIIFKHSTTCGISARSKYSLEAKWDDLLHDVDFYYLDLLTYRTISNQVVSDFGVAHQSPQVIVIHNGQAVYDTSHHRISVEDLNAALDKLG